MEEPLIVVFGAGAIGASIAAWLAPRHSRLLLVDLPERAERINREGLTVQVGEERSSVRVRAVSSLDREAPGAILLCVKNYSLEDASRRIVESVGSEVPVVGLQNGVENQEILPRRFAKPLFGVIAYNAWLEPDGAVGAQKRGPLILGAKRDRPVEELRTIAALLDKGVPTVVTDRIEDAAHTKMIVNLANSLTTLVGHGFRPISDPALFQRLLSNLAWEGVQIARAAGYREVRMEGMPSWRLMEAAAKLPLWLTRPAFNKSLRKMVVSSMAQDVIQRGSRFSELDSLNGRFIQLADRHGLAAPYNRAVYDLCRSRFAEPDFRPMDVREVWEKVRARL